MSTIVGALRTAWANLRSREHETELPAISLESLAPTVRPWAGIGRDGQARLFLPVLRRFNLETFAELQAMRIAFEPLSVRNELSFFLDLTCIERGLEETFAGFCASLIERCSGGAGTERALSLSISEFRRLFVAAVPRLAEEVIIGLCGELVVLDMLLDHDSNFVHAWTGPLGQRHDFRRGNRALEVKTSRRHEARVVTINGLEQLAPPPGGRLALAAIFLEEDPAGAISLKLLTDAIRSRLDIQGSEVFESRLTEVVGDAESLRHYTKRFSLNELLAFHVDKGFPRLSADRFITGEVDPGVGDVRYSLNLDYAQSFTFPSKNLAHFLQHED